MSFTIVCMLLLGRGSSQCHGLVPVLVNGSVVTDTTRMTLGTMLLETPTSSPDLCPRELGTAIQGCHICQRASQGPPPAKVNYCILPSWCQSLKFALLVTGNYRVSLLQGWFHLDALNFTTASQAKALLYTIMEKPILTGVPQLNGCSKFHHDFPS